jgi:drug/metabolite transporter (DMT)-like permease
VTPVELGAVLLSITLVVAGQIILKFGMARVGPIDGPRLRRPLTLVGDVARVAAVWIGMALYIASAAMWIFTLSRVPLSLAYPFLGLSYVGVAATAVIALDEWLTPAQWLGILLVVTGVVTVALSAGQ